MENNINPCIDGKYLFELRKEMNMTRDEFERKANEMELYISADKLEKIEKRNYSVHPDDIDAMAKIYGKPELRNQYCKNCKLGINLRNVENKDLGHIAIDTLNALHVMEQVENRLLSIVEDDKITPDEYRDFKNIRDAMEKLASSADNLRLWLDNEKLAHRIPENLE